MLFRRLLGEPLVHFLALGALVFAVFHFAGERGAVDEGGKIVISQGRLEQLVTGFSSIWRRPPTAAELDGLIDDYVRDEVFYREALAMGLDKDDTIVRRRMRQKLEFLTGDVSAVTEPTDRDLQAWLDRHPDKFRVEAEMAFVQIYFSPSRAGDSAPAAASKALAQLGRAAKAAPAALGDATLLPREMPLSGVDEIGRVFGEDFAKRLAQLEPGRWSGPLQSGYGWHLVRVNERTQGRSRPLSEVRGDVLREWRAGRSQETVDALFEKMRAKYVVVLEKRSARAGATGSASGIATASPGP